MAPPIADDYGFMLPGFEGGKWAAIWRSYSSWNPRLGELLAHVIGWQGNQFVFFILNPLMLYGICLGLYRFATESWPLRSIKDAILFGCTLILFFSGAGCGDGSIFWFSGTINWCWPFLAVIWLCCIIRDHLKMLDPGGEKLILAAFLAFISGWYAESISPLLLLASLILLIKYRKTSSFRLLLITNLFLLTGLIILGIGYSGSQRLSHSSFCFAWFNLYVWELFFASTYPVWIMSGVVLLVIKKSRIEFSAYLTKSLLCYFIFFYWQQVLWERFMMLG